MLLYCFNVDECNFTLIQEEIEKEKNRLHEYFSSGEGRSSGVTCLYFRVYSDRSVFVTHDSSPSLPSNVVGFVTIHKNELILCKMLYPRLLWFSAMCWQDDGKHHRAIHTCAGKNGEWEQVPWEQVPNLFISEVSDGVKLCDPIHVVVGGWSTFNLHLMYIGEKPPSNLFVDHRGLFECIVLKRRNQEMIGFSPCL